MIKVNLADWAKVIQPPPTPGESGVVDELISHLGGHGSRYFSADISLPVEDAEVIIEAVRARKEIGLDKYGTVLKSNNGRVALVDALQEVADMVIYLAQYCMEDPKDEGREELLGTAMALLCDLVDEMKWIDAGGQNAKV